MERSYSDKTEHSGSGGLDSLQISMSPNLILISQQDYREEQPTTNSRQPTPKEERDYPQHALQAAVAECSHGSPLDVGSWASDVGRSIPRRCRLTVRKHQVSRCGRSQGFTLIEVLLVVAIIGVLATIGVLSLPGRREKAMITATRGMIASISTAVELYEVDTGRFPPSLQSLVSSDGSPNWQGPYVKGGVPVDPWGVEMQYSSQSAKTFKITSAGPDAQFGSGDDITSF